MELDHNLLFNFTSIFATILLVLVTSTTVVQRLKLRWPVKVNCWFCNCDTKVWRQQLDWWLCPFCEQYNGFSKSGDYSYHIPEQYKVSPQNEKRYCSMGQDTETSKVVRGNLCKKCNTYESIKLLKLAEFEPIHEKNYEYEVKQFKDNLEKKYPLCANCETTVHNVLRKQAVWLAQYKMLFFKQKPIQAIINNAKYSESVFRIISTILDSMVACNTELLVLPVCGLLFQLCACWVTPIKNRSADIILSFFWICIILLNPFKDIKLLKTDLHNDWFSLEYLTQHHVIMMFALIIGFINIKPKTYKSVLNKKMSFKKIDICTKDMVQSHSCTAPIDNEQIFDKLSSNGTEAINSQSLGNTINGFIHISSKNPMTIQPPFSQNTIISSEPHSLLPAAGGATVFSSTQPLKSNILSNHLLNDSLSMLSLSEDLPKYANRAPKIFERKVYSTKSSDLFKKSNCGLSKKSILSPPKLKSVMQTSWVAGGYWQEGIDAPTLSRSSSQSSGFGSSGSNFAPSREPSIHEFDQCSVMSDAMQPYHISRQNIASPVSSFYPQSSQFLSTEQKSPVCSQAMKLLQNHTPQPLLLPQSWQKNSTVFTEQYLQGQRGHVNELKNASEMQIFPSHTTIVTSPVWLPALLCGSLILNIIVLCTMLLR